MVLVFGQDLLLLNLHVMINHTNHSNANRTAYPGEYTPNPFIFEKVSHPNSYAVKSAIFSNVKVSEDSEYYVIELDAPGLRSENLLVEINDRGNLFVSGIHKENIGFLNQGNAAQENYSGFSRELALPENIDTDFVRAQCRSGVLSIWFLKTDKPYQKRASLVVVY